MQFCICQGFHSGDDSCARKHQLRRFYETVFSRSTALTRRLLIHCGALRGGLQPKRPLLRSAASGADSTPLSMSIQNSYLVSTSRAGGDSDRFAALAYKRVRSSVRETITWVEISNKKQFGCWYRVTRWHETLLTTTGESRCSTTRVTVLRAFRRSETRGKPSKQTIIRASLRNSNRRSAG